MKNSFVPQKFPLRTVHLDFHTGPDIPDVGRDFNPKKFAQTFKEAHVDSVTVFAKCHHGHLYYDTRRAERHPSLPAKLDLLGEQIEALHSVGIRAPIYLSVQCDEYAANTYPEWIALTHELKQVKRHSNGAFKPGWQIMDMSSPYQDFLADQLEEVLKKYGPVDGIFMDMCWDQVSCSKWAVDGMKRKGLNPQDETDRASYARIVAHEYMARYQKMVEPKLYRKSSMGVWFNSRPKTNLHIEKKFLRHIEVESLPTGGWGYSYFPYVSRFVRPLGKPTLSHTGRFYKSWGDNAALKPESALKYECCQILSQGMTSGVGDLLHPRGVPQKAVYQLIGNVYRHVEICEQFTFGGRLCSEIAVVVNPNLGDKPGPAGFGFVRLLQQLRQQFDVLSPESDFKSYSLVIIPETTTIDEGLKRKLQSYLKSGGKLMVSGAAALDEAGKPVMKELGIQVHGESPYSHVFIRSQEKIKGREPYDLVMYEQGFRITPQGKAKTLFQVVEPYFERSYDKFSGHDYTPPNKLSRYAAAVQNGSVITWAVPIFTAYGKNGNLEYREWFRQCLQRLLPRPLILDQGPVHLETTVLRKGDTLVVHLLSFLSTRAVDGLDLVYDPFPLVQVPLSVRMEKAPSRITLEPHGKPVDFEYKEGYAHVRATLLDGHGMLVIKK